MGLVQYHTAGGSERCCAQIFQENLPQEGWLVNILKLPYITNLSSIHLWGHTLPGLLPANDREWLRYKRGPFQPIAGLLWWAICSDNPHCLPEPFSEIRYLRIFLPKPLPSCSPFPGIRFSSYSEIPSHRIYFLPPLFFAFNYHKYISPMSNSILASAYWRTNCHTENEYDSLNQVGPRMVKWWQEWDHDKM